MLTSGPALANSLPNLNIEPPSGKKVWFPIRDLANYCSCFLVTYYWNRFLVSLVPELQQANAVLAITRSFSSPPRLIFHSELLQTSVSVLLENHCVWAVGVPSSQAPTVHGPCYCWAVTMSSCWPAATRWKVPGFIRSPSSCLKLAVLSLACWFALQPLVSKEFLALLTGSCLVSRRVLFSLQTQSHLLHQCCAFKQTHADLFYSTAPYSGCLSDLFGLFGLPAERPSKVSGCASHLSPGCLPNVSVISCSLFAQLSTQEVWSFCF